MSLTSKAKRMRFLKDIDVQWLQTSMFQTLANDGSFVFVIVPKQSFV